MKTALSKIALALALLTISTAPLAARAELLQAKKALGEFRSQTNVDLPMYIVKSAWTPDDEVRFGQFIAQLGKAISSRKCNTVKKCLQSPTANPYADLDPKGLVLYSDCADFPYFLRSYFAYHNGLPFSYVTDVTMNTMPVASENDLAAVLPLKNESTSPYGNKIEARGGANTAPQPGYEPNYITYLERMFDIVFTGTLRVSPLSKNYGLSDVYPVKLNRAGIGPGTVVHATGHALMVWNVDNEGMIHAIDAHPDGSVQFKDIEPSILGRSRPDQGLGFYRFRPLHLVNAQQASNGVFYGGKIVAATDQELISAGKYSLEQWFGPNSNVVPGWGISPKAWKNVFSKISFYDYLGQQLRDANVVIQADSAINDKFKTMCNGLITRVATVDKAIQAKANLLPHPATLPTDIFGEEDPAWGSLASPGSDNRIRQGVSDVLKAAISMYRQAKAGDKNIKFEGTAEEYVAALRSKFQETSKACVIQYTNSVGKPVRLTLEDALLRLNKFSFDYAHCAEKRWGASGAELGTCRDMDKGNVWYNAEQNIRNTIGKTTASDIAIVRSDRPITLSMLQNPALIDRPDSEMVSLGTTTPPIMNIDANLTSPKFIEKLTK